MSKKLEVGDVLYNEPITAHYGHRRKPTQRIVIERVTATQAVSTKGIKIKRETNYDGYREIGGSSAFYFGDEQSDILLSQAIEEAKTERERRALAYKAQDARFYSLTLDQLRRIHSIINEEK